MLCLYNDNTNPYFNLALEEYILKEFEDDCFMLWRNSPCIVVGKNQNTLSEINLEYVNKNSIPVVRRLSGGGAVFHDLGNLNFTFIINDNGDSFNNYRKFTEPIIEVLQKLNVNAELSGRNDLVIDGKKFSGNAQVKYKNRILHHGTLLFSANVSDISSALISKPIKFEDKSVKSISSRVTNISEHINKPLDILEFKDLIMNNIMEKHNEFTFYSLSGNDVNKVNRLVYEKYSTWEWNFGESPQYNFRNQMRFSGGLVEVNIIVDKGILKNIKIYGDFFSKCDIADIENALVNVKHNKDDIKKVLSKFNIEDYFSNISLNDLINIFF
ncbi:lipoate-protein ligase LplJ [Clostridium tepidiprofundi DSM 19306]|uniref:lipoate--protein ligase n=1 Tax=Clostridium tepidiprofundi DSM 19306 TaxID=1121338 RepID=A0A151B5R7_9CLOT|nr:lipoate--protein ligase [Clostridium tepidiprofundi]KYH35274.1 lipoate-protein ligase LplJ [Clostridium tepidiprofundi DSM 19306]